MVPTVDEDLDLLTRWGWWIDDLLNDMIMGDGLSSGLNDL